MRRRVLLTALALATLCAPLLLQPGSLATEQPPERDARVEAVQALEPRALYGGGLEEIGAFPSTYTRTDTHDREVALDPRTVRNAMALSSTGRPLTLAELALRSEGRERDTVATHLPRGGQATVDLLTDPAQEARVTGLVFESITAALLLGLPEGRITLPQLTLGERAYTQRDTLRWEPTLRDGNTMAALALNGGGVDLDSREILEFHEEAEGTRPTEGVRRHAPDPVYRQTATLPIPIAVGVQPFYRVVGPLSLRDISNVTEVADASGAAERVAALRQESVLTGLVLRNTGNRVSGTDLVDYVDTLAVRERDVHETDLAFESALSALYLGVRASR